MSYRAIHPKWEQPPSHILDGYSLEMTAKDVSGLDEAAAMIPPETPIAIAFLPSEAMDDRIAAAVHLRNLGFEPMPHLSARRIASLDELSIMTRRLADEAGVKRMFLVAGDPPVPAGPFEDTLSLLRTGLFERNGMRAIGIAGHPEGHPALNETRLWEAMEAKVADITARGMAPLIVTQFAFDAKPVLAWLETMRRRGIDAPVRIGLPGPAGIKRLLKYASICGVGASTTVLRKYGISLTKLAGTAGPEKLVDNLRAGLGSVHGRVRLHLYPFGGLKPTVDWIETYTHRHAPAILERT